jgi:type IV pilus assembly protein PilA
MYSFRKSKKGFTLIELMVVVAIIGVLSLLGLRLYTGQQNKAKEAIVKANVGTAQTLVQAELADGALSDVNEAVGIANLGGMRNPFDSEAAVVVASATLTPGAVQVTMSGTSYFTFRGVNADKELFGDTLTAQR